MPSSFYILVSRRCCKRRFPLDEPSDSCTNRHEILKASAQEIPPFGSRVYFHAVKVLGSCQRGTISADLDEILLFHRDSWSL